MNPLIVNLCIIFLFVRFFNVFKYFLNLAVNKLHAVVHENKATHKEKQQNVHWAKVKEQVHQASKLHAWEIGFNCELNGEHNHAEKIAKSADHVVSVGGDEDLDGHQENEGHQHKGSVEDERA
jgi:hypothetical protein